MPCRPPTEILLPDGRSLADVLDRHRRWLWLMDDDSRADLRDAVLRDADLRDADLRGADLRGAVLSRADLRRADLRDADLRDADLSVEVPVIPGIHQAVYAAATSRPDALDMGVWHRGEDIGETHSCGTAHCRAGWVVTLAGEPGRALEAALGSPSAAAALIYAASDPTLDHTPDFSASVPNAVALADMERLARAEALRAPVTPA